MPISINNAGGTGTVATPSLAQVLAVGNDANALKIVNLADPAAAQDAATKAYVDAQVVGAGGPWPAGTKFYIAIVAQSGTGTPTSTVLVNTYGNTPTWSRISAGAYRLSFTGSLLVSAKTVFWATNVGLVGGGVAAACLDIDWLNADTLTFDCVTAAGPIGTDISRSHLTLFIATVP